MEGFLRPNTPLPSCVRILRQVDKLTATADFQATLAAHEDGIGRRYLDLADPWSQSELQQRLESLTLSGGPTGRP